MYREAPPSSQVMARERELVYLPRTDVYAFSSLAFAVFIFSTGVLMGGVVAASISPNIGGAGILVATIAPVVMLLVHRRPARITLRIEQGDLFVEERGRLRANIALNRLRSVDIDSGGWRRGDVGPGCIVLVPEEPQPRLALTARRIPHEDCVEWAAKVRTFLRLHRWMPVDERPV
jgi:hypothetical protein